MEVSVRGSGPFARVVQYTTEGAHDKVITVHATLSGSTHLLCELNAALLFFEEASRKTETELSSLLTWRWSWA